MSNKRAKELSGFIDNAIFAGDSPLKIAEMCMVLTTHWLKEDDDTIQKMKSRIEKQDAIIKGLIND